MESLVTNLFSGFARAYIHIEDWVSGLFAFSGKAVPISTIADLVDPRFLPKAPMSGEDIDIDTRLKLSKFGFKNAKLITAESHPDFYDHWKILCSRAGFSRPMQLILCESDIPNAAALSSSEMAISTGLLQRMTYREVCAIVSHELGHANNWDEQQMKHAAAAGGLSILGLVLPFPNEHIGWRSTLLSSIGIFGVGHVTGSKISGYATELQADIEGAVISHDPEALASALEKLQGEVGTLPKWRQLLSKVFDVHPNVPERVKWLQEVKQQLDGGTVQPAYVAPTNRPTLQIAGGQTEHERVSTNTAEAAISGA